jgi:hypothetical protein
MQKITDMVYDAQEDAYVTEEYAAQKIQYREPKQVSGIARYAVSKYGIAEQPEPEKKGTLVDLIA